MFFAEYSYRNFGTWQIPNIDLTSYTVPLIVDLALSSLYILMQMRSDLYEAA